MLCVRDIGQPAKFHRADVAKMHARTKHMAKEKVGTSSTNADKAFHTKDPLTKPPRQNPPRTIKREFVQGAFVRVFCTRPTKNQRGPRCVTYFWGSRCNRPEYTPGRIIPG